MRGWLRVPVGELAPGRLWLRVEGLAECQGQRLRLDGGGGGLLPPGESTEMLVEEFQIKEDGPWYHPQGLQQDLQLAAEWEDITGSEHRGGGFSSADVHNQSGAVPGN